MSARRCSKNVSDDPVIFISAGGGKLAPVLDSDDIASVVVQAVSGQAPHPVAVCDQEVIERAGHAVEKHTRVTLVVGIGQGQTFQLVATPMAILLKDRGENERRSIIGSVAAKTAALSSPEMLREADLSLLKKRMSPLVVLDYACTGQVRRPPGPYRR